MFSLDNRARGGLVTGYIRPIPKYLSVFMFARSVLKTSAVISSPWFDPVHVEIIKRWCNTVMVFFILASDLRDFKPDESFSLFMLGLSQFGWAEGKSKDWVDQNIKSGEANAVLKSRPKISQLEI